MELNKRMGDLDILIAVRIADNYRVHNLINSINGYFYNFDVDITVLEADKESRHADVIPHLLKPVNWYFVKDESDTFHRTRYMNLLGRKSTKPILVFHDMDVLLYPNSLWKYYKKFVDNSCDWGHPFAAGTMRSWAIDMNDHDKQLYRKYMFHGHALSWSVSGVGYCIWSKKDYFFEAGGWNEKLVAYSPDDVETTYRLRKWGGKYLQAPAPVYHIEHPRNHNSDMHLNPYYKIGLEEYTKVKSLDKAGIEEYKKTMTYEPDCNWDVISAIP